MTVENLHDAIGQLPGDLIAEADRRRSHPRRVIPWQRYTAMAACLALILCASLFFTRLFAPKGAGETSAEAAVMQGPPEENCAAAAPAEARDQIAEEPAAIEAEPIPTYGANDSLTTAEEPHIHKSAGEPEICTNQESGAWCGNMTATVFYGEEIRTLEGETAIALVDILYFLDYQEENLCRCDGEFTVDIETGDLYEVSLSQYFVRCQGGQANLTEEQAQSIEAILNGMEVEP